MDDRFRDNQQRKETGTRMIVDLVRGGLILVIGIFFLTYQDDSVKIIGGVFVLFGAWRVYRGYKKHFTKS